MNYNCYNEALEYLIEKYGEKQVPVSRFNKKQARTFKDECKFVGEEYVPIITGDDRDIVRLLGQYYYGIEAKKELYYKLLSKGIIQ